MLRPPMGCGRRSSPRWRVTAWIRSRPAPPTAWISRSRRRDSREFPGTSLEMLPGTTTFTEQDKEILTQMSLAANRPLNWNLLAPRADMPEFELLPENARK